MKKTIIGIISTLYSTFSFGISDCSQFYYKNVQPISPTTTEEYCMDRFVVQFSLQMKTPLWSAQRLTREDVRENKAKPRINNFHSENMLPIIYQAKNKDYENSGFDRGHLTAYKDQAASIDINSLINIVPQNPRLNRNQWEALESKIRNDAVRYGELYVITGVIFKDNKKIGKNIPVPTQIYKIVYYPNREKAYLADNIDDSFVNETTISHIESLSGVIFTKNN